MSNYPQRSPEATLSNQLMKADAYLSKAVRGVEHLRLHYLARRRLKALLGVKGCMTHMRLCDVTARKAEVYSGREDEAKEITELKAPALRFRRPRGGGINRAVGRRGLCRSEDYLLDADNRQGRAPLHDLQRGALKRDALRGMDRIRSGESDLDHSRRAHEGAGNPCRAAVATRCGTATQAME